MHPLLRTFLTRQTTLGTLALLTDLAASILALLLPLLLSNAYAVQFGFESARAHRLGLPDASFPVLLRWLVTVLVMKTALDLLRRYLHGLLAERFVAGLRRLLFAHHLRMPLRTYEKKGEGRFLLRFSGDLGSIHQLISKGIFQFAADASLLFLGLLLMFVLDARLGLLISVQLAVFGWLIGRINKRIAVVERRRRDKKSALLAFVAARLRQMAPIKALNRSTREQQRFDRIVNRLEHLGLQYAGWVARLDALSGFGVYAISVFVLAAAWWFQQFGPDQVFAVLLLLISWRPVLLRVFQVGLVWKRGAISLEKIQSLITGPADPVPPMRTVKKSASAPVLAVNHITNGYLERSGAGNLNFTLTPGQIGWITGKSGAGKTALVKILAGLYTPSSGAVLLDGRPSDEWGLLAWRKQLAFVSEAFPLYGENVVDALSNSAKKANRMLAASMLANWKIRLPFLTEVSTTDAPDALTKEQARALECLRLVLANKPIWVLDEPFQGMDAHHAMLLSDLLFEARQNRSVLVLSPDAPPLTMERPDWQLVLSVPLAQKLSPFSGN